MLRAVVCELVAFPGGGTLCDVSDLSLIGNSRGGRMSKVEVEKDERESGICGFMRSESMCGCAQDKVKSVGLYH